MQRNTTTSQRAARPKPTSRNERKSDSHQTLSTRTKESSQPSTLQDVDFVLGPVGLDEYRSNHYDLIAYVFADEHVRQTDCSPSATPQNTVHISKLIRWLVKSQAPETVDVYFEALFAEPHGKTPPLARADHYLSDLLQKWNDCLQVDKTTCRLSNARVHYADVRTPARLDPGFRRRQLLHALHGLIESNETKDAKTAQLHLQAIRQRKATLSQDKAAFQLAYALEQAKVNKQMANIPEASIRKALTAYFQPSLQVSIATEAALDDALEQWQTTGDKSKLVRLNRRILQFLTLPQDWYLMARLFRIFSEKPKSASTTTTTSSSLPDLSFRSRANRAILYVGMEHAERYRQIFALLGFQRVRHAISDGQHGHSMQCLPVASFRPWFSRSHKSSASTASTTHTNVKSHE